MNIIEIEIQVQLEHVEPLKQFLTEHAEKTGESRLVDQYYTPAHRNFLAVRPTAEWLRLRDADGRCSINYKKWHYDDQGKSHHCDEYETPVESRQVLELIFASLDCKPIVKVDKRRATFRWKDYEIALDHVKGLGDFVEIEYKGTSDGSDAKKITDGMMDFLKNLGVGKIYRNYVGYPFQLLFPDEVVLEEC